MRSEKSFSEAPLLICGWISDFKSLSAAANKSDSEDLPAFLVTIHSYELPNWKSPDTMALNLVTDIVFSNRRYGAMKGMDFGDGSMLRKVIRIGTKQMTHVGSSASGMNMVNGRIMQNNVNE